MGIVNKIKKFFNADKPNMEELQQSYEQDFICKNKNTKFILDKVWDFKNPPTNQRIVFIPEGVRYHARECCYGNIHVDECMIPQSPATLLHCVTNLTRKEKLSYGKTNLNDLTHRLFKIAENAKFGTKEEWRDAIYECGKHITQNFWNEQPNLFTVERLQKVDWKKVGGEFKRAGSLPPSYDKQPADVQIYTAPDGSARVKLKMQSKTSPSYRVLSIRYYDISEALNSEIHFTENPEISKVWKNVYKSLLDQQLWRMSIYDDPRYRDISDKKTPSDYQLYAQANGSYEKI